VIGGNSVVCGAECVAEERERERRGTAVVCGAGLALWMMGCCQAGPLTLASAFRLSHPHAGMRSGISAACVFQTGALTNTVYDVRFVGWNSACMSLGWC
jgi:hypothetical protein